MITIDGPAGSGKSTTARLVAERLGLTYLDTGALFRALTFLALEQGLDLDDGAALAELSQSSDLRIATTPEKTRIWSGDREITDSIRAPRVSQQVSLVASHPPVRQEMLRLQRELAAGGDVVVEGRDIGTVVFPDAPLKVFMQASIAARARRRHEELLEQGQEVSVEAVEAELARRDVLDTSRKAAPLRKPEKALVIDTTNLTIEQQVDRIVQAYRALKPC